jgi:hypothetical protein
MILGLANFTVGKTRQAITQMLDQAQLYNRKIDWSIILETAIKAEKLFGVHKPRCHSIHQEQQSQLYSHQHFSQ